MSKVYLSVWNKYSFSTLCWDVASGAWQLRFIFINVINVNSFFSEPSNNNLKQSKQPESATQAKPIQNHLLKGSIPLSHVPTPPPPPPPPPPITSQPQLPPRNNSKNLEITSYTIPVLSDKTSQSNFEYNNEPKILTSTPTNDDNHYAVSNLVTQNNSNLKSGFTTIEQQQHRLINNTNNISKGTPNLSTRSTSRRTALEQHHKQTVTGSFDPSDFDSFDEGDDENGSYYLPKKSSSSLFKQTLNNQANKNGVPSPFNPIEKVSIEKIRETALIQQEKDVILPNEVQHQKSINLVQFDPNDFDSFDEDEQLSPEAPLNINYNNPQQLPLIKLSDEEHEKNNQSLNKVDGETRVSSETNDRHSEFIANRNKLEAMFKRNAGFTSSQNNNQLKNATTNSANKINSNSNYEQAKIMLEKNFATNNTENSSSNEQPSVKASIPYKIEEPKLICNEQIYETKKANIANGNLYLS